MQEAEVGETSGWRDVQNVSMTQCPDANLHNLRHRRLDREFADRRSLRRTWSVDAHRFDRRMLAGDSCGRAPRRCVVRGVAILGSIYAPLFARWRRFQTTPRPINGRCLSDNGLPHGPSIRAIGEPRRRRRHPAPVAPLAANRQHGRHAEPYLTIMSRLRSEQISHWHVSRLAGLRGRLAKTILTGCQFSGHDLAMMSVTSTRFFGTSLSSASATELNLCFFPKIG